MGFPRQEYWRGLPFPPPGDLPDPGIKALIAGGLFTAGRPGRPLLLPSGPSTACLWPTGRRGSLFPPSGRAEAVSAGGLAPGAALTSPAEQPGGRAWESPCAEAPPGWAPLPSPPVNSLCQTCFSDAERNRYTWSREGKEELKDKRRLLGSPPLRMRGRGPRATQAPTSASRTPWWPRGHTRPPPRPWSGWSAGHPSPCF